MKSASFVIAVLVGLIHAMPVLAQGAGPSSTVAPSPVPAPSPQTPPPYAYPPGYAYPPPAYAYPPPGAYLPPGYGYPPAHAYPQPSPYPQPQHGYYQDRPAAEQATPFVGPTGKLRIGASVGLFLAGRLSYKLLFRGEPLVSHSHSAKVTPGLAIFAEYQPIRFLFLGFTVQYLTTVKWTQAAAVVPDSSTSPYRGSGYAIDLLPRLGVSYPLTPRVWLIASGAPGYSRIDASDMIKVYANPGTVSGFTIQGDAGALFSFSQNGFLQGRLSYQSSFLESSTASATTGEPAKAELRARYWSINAGVGYWF